MVYSRAIATSKLKDIVVATYADIESQVQASVVLFQLHLATHATSLRSIRQKKNLRNCKKALLMKQLVPRTLSAEYGAPDTPLCFISIPWNVKNLIEGYWRIAIPSFEEN